jgi:hypothetical protein
MAALPIVLGTLAVVVYIFSTRVKTADKYVNWLINTYYDIRQAECETLYAQHIAGTFSRDCWDEYSEAHARLSAAVRRQIDSISTWPLRLWLKESQLRAPGEEIIREARARLKGGSA